MTEQEQSDPTLPESLLKSCLREMTWPVVSREQYCSNNYCVGSRMPAPIHPGNTDGGDRGQRCI